jgi:hypothetical protein
MYTSCNIQWVDDGSISENVIIKSSHDVIESEDDQIFFYGLSPEFLKWAKETGEIIENEWRVVSVNDIAKKL